jgi:hypothetical protein
MPTTRGRWAVTSSWTGRGCLFQASAFAVVDRGVALQSRACVEPELDRPGELTFALGIEPLTLPDLREHPGDELTLLFIQPHVASTFAHPGAHAGRPPSWVAPSRSRV